MKYYHACGTRSTHDLVDQEDHGAAFDLVCLYEKRPQLALEPLQCSGGDEGDRTPDLLTASQALSQLSYAPVRKSTIRELGRRCKDNFGKSLAGAARAAVQRCPELSKLAALLADNIAFKSKQARHVAWPVENPGGPSGIRTQNPGIMSPLR